LTALRYWSARRIDLEARKAAQIASEAAARSKPVDFKESEFGGTKLVSVTAGVRDGRVFGSGKFVGANKDNKPFTWGFIGAWLGSSAEGSSQKPDLGLFELGNGCTFSGRFKFTETNSTAMLGVLRRNNAILFIGDRASGVAFASNAETSVCFGGSG
jgi:hypothetical protein